MDDITAVRARGEVTHRQPQEVFVSKMKSGIRTQEWLTAQPLESTPVVCLWSSSRISHNAKYRET